MRCCSVRSIFLETWDNLSLNSTFKSLTDSLCFLSPSSLPVPLNSPQSLENHLRQYDFFLAKTTWTRIFVPHSCNSLVLSSQLLRKWSTLRPNRSPNWRLTSYYSRFDVQNGNLLVWFNMAKSYFSLSLSLSLSLKIDCVCVRGLRLNACVSILRSPRHQEKERGVWKLRSEIGLSTTNIKSYHNLWRPCLNESSQLNILVKAQTYFFKAEK